jgi:hypothetical protein
MPKFLAPNNPALNTLVKAKKIVNARNKKKFKDTEPAIQSLLGQEELYAALTNRMTAINASLIEISSALVLTADALAPRGNRRAQQINTTIADRYLTASANLVKLSKDALLFVRGKLKGSLNQFTFEQVNDVANVLASIQTKEETIEEVLDELPDGDTADRLADIFDEYDNDLREFLNVIESALLNYRQIQQSGTPFGEATMMGMGALRSGLDFGPTWTLSCRHPPRDRADLIRPSLPYRFR